MPQGPKNFTKTELQAGAVVLTSGVIFIVFLMATTTLRPTEERKTFRAYFENTVGLNRGAEVRFGGVQVGTVTRIEPAPDRQSMILVEARIAASTPVNEGSEAYISQVTLTSQKHLAITTGREEAALLEGGAVIPLGSGDLFTQLAGTAGDISDLIHSVNRLMGTEDETGAPLPAGEFGTVGQLLLTLDTTVNDVQVLLGVREVDVSAPDFRDDLTTVAAILEGVESAVDGGGALMSDVREILDDNREAINEIIVKVIEIEDSAHKLITDLDAIIVDNRGNIDSAFEDLAALLKTGSRTAEQLAGQLETLTETLQRTLDNVEHLTGDAQFLLERNTPAIEDIILDVKDITRDLKEFSRTLADEPQAVIRGKSVSGRQ